jgi:ABC-type branched-subunit amino acid transport system substrate-binding protein
LDGASPLALFVTEVETGSRFCARPGKKTRAKKTGILRTSRAICEAPRFRLRPPGRIAKFGFSTLIALSQCSSGLFGAQPGESGDLKLGMLLPPEEPQAISLREGALLAQEQVNRGSTGRVAVLIRGRVGQWGADAVEAARMVTDDGVAGLIAPPDGAASHLVLQVSGRTAVPVISLCADSSVSQTGVPWLLRVVPRTVEEAKALFTSAIAGAPGKTNYWAAIVPAGRAGREISHDLKMASLVSGCRLDKTIEINSALTKIDVIGARVLTGGPDGVLLWLDPLPAASVAKKLRAAGYAGTLAGPGRLFCAAFAGAAGESLERFVIPGIVSNDQSDARWNSFREVFHQRWGHEPDSMAGMSYDATMLLNDLLRQAYFQAPPHRLPPDFSWPGVTGNLSFDPPGNRQVELQLLVGHQGRFAASTRSKKLAD